MVNVVNTEAKSYFTLREWLIIILLAVASASINSYLPIKSITEHLHIPGPAGGMALFGGFIFVLWISLSCQASGKKYTGIITSIVITSICLLIRPWYGITSPAWFGIYGLIGLLSMGMITELTQSKSSWLRILGGGLGNLSCLAITWLAIGVHTDIWTPREFTPLLILGAIASGCAGILLADGINRVIKISLVTKC